MLPSNQQSLEPVLALAAAIAKRQTPQQRGGRNLRMAFAEPGQGVVPSLGASGNGMASNIPPPDPGQLSVPDGFNPSFPSTAAPPPPPLPAPDPSRFGASTPAAVASMAPPQSYFPGKTADDMGVGLPPPAAAPQDAQPPLIGSPDPTAGLTPPQDQPGILGRLLPTGVRNGLVDAMAALGASDPTAPGLQTLGQAFTGAQRNKRAREDRKTALVTAADDKSYERGRDARADNRADRTLSLQEKKAASDDRVARLSEIQTAAGIDKTQAETRKIEREYANGGLSTQDMLDVETRVVDYGKTLEAGAYADAPTEDIVNRNKNLMDKYRSDLIQSLKKGTNTPDGPGGEVPMTDQPSDTSEGASSSAGTWDAPVNLGGMSGDALRSAVQKLPKGSIFLDSKGNKMERQ